jgi:hypothetical protein
MRVFLKYLMTLAWLGLSVGAFADGSGVITDMHYSIFDQDQSTTICFQAAGVALAFVSNGSEKHKAISALLISAFVAGKTISFSLSPSPMSPAPCQSWEFPTTVYQVYALAFQP